MTFVTENMALLTGRPEHVEALKQHILSLAVRGLLVPQEEGDEPAGAGIKQIMGEEVPFQAPKGWVWIRLGEVAEDVSYGTSEKATDNPDMVPILRMGNITSEGFIDYSNLKYVSSDIKDLPRLYLKNGDIVFNRTNSYELVGKSAVYQGPDDTYTLASYLIRLAPDKNLVLPGFINIYLNSKVCRETQIEPEITKQTNQANFNGTKLKNIQFPLPPLPEQHRIVAKVASLFSLIDRLSAAVREGEETRRRWLGALLRDLGEARSGEEVRMRWGQLSAHFDELIDSVEAVKSLRQVILQLAVRGVLVEQDAGEEPAGAGLKHIGPDEAPYELPKGWVWVRLEEVAEDVSYGTSEKATGDSSMVPILRMGNITSDGFIDYNDLKYVSSDIKDLPRLYLKSGDVVFNRTNSYELVGKSAVYDGPDDIYTFASYLIRFSPSKNLVIPDFINIYLNSKVCRETQIEPEITKQTNQANFNGTKLKNIQFPLPPLSEQRRIVERVERLMEWCDGLEAGLEAGEGVMGRVVRGLQVIK